MTDLSKLKKGDKIVMTVLATVVSTTDLSLRLEIGGDAVGQTLFYKSFEPQSLKIIDPEPAVGDVLTAMDGTRNTVYTIVGFFEPFWLCRTNYQSETDPPTVHRPGSFKDYIRTPKQAS